MLYTCNVGTRMVRQNLVQLALGLGYFARRDLYIRGLTLHTAQRLMYHHARVRQRRTLACGARRKQHGPHRRGQPRTDGRHVTRDKLHRIVDTEPRRHRTARRIDVYLHILRRVDRLEKQQLCLYDVGRIVVDGGPEEDDAIHHQSREDIHRSHVQLSLLDYRRRDVGRLHRLEVVQRKAADAAVSACIFLKFAHIRIFFVRKPPRRNAAPHRPPQSKNGLCKHYAQSPYPEYFVKYYSSCASLANSSDVTVLVVTLIFDFT